MSIEIPPPPPLQAIPTTFAFKRPIRNGLTESCLIPLVNKSLYNKYNVTELRPILQTGPNCGLAALAMAAAVTPCSLSLQDFCDQAILAGFSKKGEMFSVENMKLLAEATLSTWFKIEMFSGGLEDHQAFIFKRLQECDLLLVPYDADKNDYPCCRKGHKAHWAILCGHLEGNDGCMYVAARQGKSRHVAVWPFTDLKDSNSNLYELDPKKEQCEKEYILPHGGVKEGLSGKFILLHRY